MNQQLQSALDDVKAGAAAFDDARCTLFDLLQLSLSGRDRVTLEAIKDAADLTVGRANGVVGGLVRFQERQTP